MKLMSARITNYRCVEDSGEFTIEPDVTCLAGKAESGKTNIEQALYLLNPVESSAASDEVLDISAWLTRQRTQSDQMLLVVTAAFRYDDDRQGGRGRRDTRAL